MTTELRRTALHAAHEAAGARFTDFGGWDMPLRYASELAEHEAVRTAAGLFDLSHMGEVWVTGPDAATGLNSVLAGNLAVIKVGKAKYSLMLDEDGGIIDDLIVYRLAEDRYLVVPNAGNAEAVTAELQRVLVDSGNFDVTLDDATARTSLLAVQGPAAEQIVARLLTSEADHQALAELRYYAAIELDLAVSVNAAGEPSDVTFPVLVARTGYTGEDGFELILDPAHPRATEAGADAEAVPSQLWDALLAVGEADQLIPCGLAARDSLRLEAGMPLYGNELSRDRTPFDAGLGPVVSFKKTEDFPGRSALEPLREQPSAWRLIGLQGLERRAARPGSAILINGESAGEVTSGLPSPTLGYPIALGYVSTEAAAGVEPDTELTVDIRGKAHPFRVVQLPFYTR
ncbi:glycine cleavage system aminomethyltransferase GcvT [Citricoccus muralis]|uniref:Aminomethyltransferase n=1 Tax=Citricoccus muralis TaxID=169134 RepID=A0ABY8H9S7_9MICC|nr:glycine cleavage system aminomethyltransferase GcvT [Citricoccus muralis]WFP17470.1 glycine cleavage system aminomethyltransferase GcvT [Citricoccus muralis]